jgi:NAD(P)-dependent dehydrogenase (short-subunit alcohol dehydrogenase family)
VAVFVGGTSGLGKEAAKRLATSVRRPVIFLVGRNQRSATSIIAEMKALNRQGTYNFIQSDVSLLRNVDIACQAIGEQASVLDLLFLSTGSALVPRKGTKNLECAAFFAMSILTQKDTVEGLEQNQVERYYSRMRFVTNLMPRLKASKSPRVVSVLLAGYEIEIDESDLELPKPCSSIHATKHASTMTSLAMEYLAAKNPSVSFVHVFPGIVKTPLFDRGLGWFFAKIMWMLYWPFSLSLEHSGHYNVYVSTSPVYPPSTQSNSQDNTTSIIGSGKKCIASTGEVGGGCYILNYKGDNAANDRLMEGYRKRGYPHKVWSHTLDVFQSVVGHSRSVPDN